MGAYKNVMELLVEEEVMRQCKSLPPRMASYMNPVELVAYALNQLPPLYATSERGLSLQLERGREKYASQIGQAVQRAIAAVRRDPLRASTPLPSPQAAPLRDTLQQLRSLLKDDQVDWATLPVAVETALKLARKTTSQTSVPSRVTSSSQQSSPFAFQSASQTESPPTQPLTKRYLGRGIKQNPTQKQNAPQQSDNRNDAFGWDNPLYDSH